METKKQKIERLKEIEDFQVIAVCSSDKNNKIHYKILYSYLTRNNCEIYLCLNNKPLIFKKEKDAIRIAKVLNQSKIGE